MKQKNDIFDCIMKFPLFRFFQPFYTQHKEILLYLFFGGLSFILNIGLFTFLTACLYLNEHVANVASWIITVLFVYVTNKLWVFNDCENTQKSFISQLFSFFVARIGTLLLEELIIYIFITVMSFNPIIVKIVAQVIVIIANYILSKMWIFRKKENSVIENSQSNSESDSVKRLLTCREDIEI